MPNANNLISQFYITLDGQELTDELMREVQSITVENSLHMPDVATLVINDPALKWIDDARFVAGKPVKVQSKSSDARAQSQTVFDGEIVEIEPDFQTGWHHLVIRAYDRLHRLARGRKARSFQNVSDGDVVKKLVQEVGLDGDIIEADQVYDYLFQNNETNFDFLRRRASNLGYLLYVQGKKVCFKPPPEQTSAAIELRWGDSLSEFRPRLTTLGQLNTVMARGWDVKNKREIVGRARAGKGMPNIKIEKKGGDAARSAFNIDTTHLVANQPIRTQAAADRIAQAVADRHSEQFVEAEGTCSGNPAIVAGAAVKIESVGTRFSGTYFVTAATHIYSVAQGYTTQFAVSGQTPSTLLNLLRPAQDEALSHTAGLVIGIVTDNNDPEGYGRVKVKYPWLAPDHASDWARLTAPGAGKERGIQFVPEVDDEVLIGFEMGDIHQPYVLGGLWNGVDAMPKKSGDVVSTGKVRQRLIRSRSGHEILLDDSEGAEKIIIKDKTNNNLIEFDAVKNKISITADGDLVMEARGNINLKANGEIKVEATGKASLKGMGVEVNGGGSTVDVTGSMINLN